MGAQAKLESRMVRCNSGADGATCGDAACGASATNGAMNSAEAGYVASQQLLTMAGVKLRQHALRGPIQIGKAPSANGGAWCI